MRISAFGEPCGGSTRIALPLTILEVISSTQLDVRNIIGHGRGTKLVVETLSREDFSAAWETGQDVV